MIIVMAVSEKLPLRVRNFIQSYLETIIFIFGLSLILIWSFFTLETKPKIWIDESVTIDIARSFLTDGILAPQTAPGVFFSTPYLIQSTGYPVTVALAGFFGLFGYGFLQARIFMLFGIVAVLGILFFLGRRLFSQQQAILAFLLIASFASFYGSGRTAVGEIPGFFFLVAGLALILLYERFFWAGLVLGLAVVSKPSVFALIIPTLFLLWAWKGREGWRKLFSVGIGMVPAGLLAVLLAVPEPFSPKAWQEIAHFYNNPYSSSVSDHVLQNLGGFFHSSTLLYFSIFFLLILYVRKYVEEKRLRFLYSFTLLYSILAFFYYLRSPGWLRYILIAELLILFLVPHAVTLLCEHLKQKFPTMHNTSATWGLAFLVVFQTIQLLTVAQIFYGDGALKAAAYINKNFPSRSVGLLDTMDVAILLDTPRRFLILGLTGVPPLGDNPLLGDSLPEIVTGRQTSFWQEGKTVLEKNYSLIETVGGYPIYKKL
jgi:4-amino-4-deoxy-L-arabinose transferase-like glycosyltransferase